MVFFFSISLDPGNSFPWFISHVLCAWKGDNPWQNVHILWGITVMSRIISGDEEYIFTSVFQAGFKLVTPAFALSRELGSHLNLCSQSLLHFTCQQSVINKKLRLDCMLKKQLSCPLICTCHEMYFTTLYYFIVNNISHYLVQSVWFDYN